MVCVFKLGKRNRFLHELVYKRVFYWRAQKWSWNTVVGSPLLGIQTWLNNFKSHNWRSENVNTWIQNGKLVLSWWIKRWEENQHRKSILLLHCCTPNQNLKRFPTSILYSLTFSVLARGTCPPAKCCTSYLTFSGTWTLRIQLWFDAAQGTERSPRHFTPPYKAQGKCAQCQWITSV